MALKRTHSMTATFSMASMTDVIFLLLIFFMVTSTFVFPTALEVNLPQSTQQTALKPTLRLYIDDSLTLYKAIGDENPTPIEKESLATWLRLQSEQQESTTAALYADETVPYGNIVDVLNAGTSAHVKIVLATRPVSTASVKKYLQH
ncbi:MAG: biopolymer transporter ExbD [Muribaculaceae bacterium]|nr:biopolymer transporter ExbD [Muribaculaceae bacterium]